MARSLSQLVVLAALVLPLALTAWSAIVFAAEVAPPSTLTIQPLEATDVYIVRLDNPSLARYGGGTGGLAATSVEATGAARLDTATRASQLYLAHLAEGRVEFLRHASERLGRQVEAGYVYDVILNGLTVELTPSEAALVRTLPGVVHVERREYRQLLTDRGPQWIGAAAAWGAAAACAPGGNCGEGVIVGVVDTGLNFDHPSFADTGGDGYDHVNPFGPGVYVGWCNPGYPVQVQCNDKVIGAWSYPNSGNNPEDPEGHGSHTASTAAGNRLNGILLDAPSIGLTFDISGVAPHANLIVYDACTLDGCSTDDLIAALQRAVDDGVDALNYSISGSAESPWVAADEQAFLDLRAAGVFVSASAGNSGPAAATVAHGSPWVTTTAASTHDRALVNAVVDMTSSSGVLADIYGRGVTTSYGLAPIVYAGDYGGNNLCLDAVWTSGTFSGQIVVCDRGNNARVDKAINVRDAGGGGMILANAASNGDEEIGDAYAIPGVHISYDEGVALKSWLAAGADNLGRIHGTQIDLRDNNGDVMAAFSSRGPNNQAPGILKPDMTAPGVDILAAVASLGQAAPEFDVYSGTSMSSPHMTGAGALMMKAKYPAWSVAEIQSSLMTTAVFDNTVREEDGATPTDPFDRGAGRVNIAAALDAGLLLDITGAQYAAADPALGGDPRTLNYPSMADDACYGSCGWTRAVRNPTGQSMTWNGIFAGKDGLEATLTVPSFTIAAGGTQSIGVNITGVAPLTPGQWYFGHVVYTEDTGDAPQVHFPVAVRVAGSTDATVIEKTATPAGAGMGAEITYAVTVKNKEASARTFSVSDVVPAGATYVGGSAIGGWTYDSGTNTVSGPVSLPAADFLWREENRSGYQSMFAEGIPPADLTGVNGDTGCFLLNGMNFYYLGQHYTEVVVSMNGVIRAGAPASGYCPSDTPLNIPVDDGENNNNLIAPFWADLDMTRANMYLVLTTLNSKPHTVIEWENARVGRPPKSITFQLWIEDGTDNIWFAYPAGFNTTTGSSSPAATIGAENATGTDAARYYYNGTGTVPTGAVDVWVGLEPAGATLGFRATAAAAAGSDVTNEVSVTVGATTDTARANTHICGPAAPAQPEIAIQGLYYTLAEWAGSPHDSYELWRSTTPYFTPGVGSDLVYAGEAFSFVDADGGATVGDPAVNHFYVLRTINCAGTSSADSHPVAEFDFALAPGQ